MCLEVQKVKVNLSFQIDEDVAGKFSIALNLTNDVPNEVIENCMRKYIAAAFSNVASSMAPLAKAVTNDNPYYGKANQRIPKWAQRPNQYNHKIIRAYFLAEHQNGTVTLSDMKALCSDESTPELYVPTFSANYAQMKLDGQQTHGKVFEDDGTIVTIWPVVRDVLMQYKSSFC